MPASKKFVYPFAAGGKELVELLGSKGAHVSEMFKMGIPVPPGFVITTEAFRSFKRKKTLEGDVVGQIIDALVQLTNTTGLVLNQADYPLVVSVRSGAPVSMPGMMDTILDLGINDVTFEGFAKRTSKLIAEDSYKRFLVGFGSVVCGIPKESFPSLSIGSLNSFKKVFTDTFPSSDTAHLVFTDAHWALRKAVEAVFLSWDNSRAKVYRKNQHIPATGGTACVVMSMVFGNTGSKSGTGVVFTRNPSTGVNELFGEFLPNGQGEDVVSGAVTPLSMSEMQNTLPQCFSQLATIAATLEKHYQDVQDIEFTVENGTLYILQTRSAKRSDAARLRILLELITEGIRKPTTEDLAEIVRLKNSVIKTQVITNLTSLQVAAHGLGAAPGIVTGVVANDGLAAAKYKNAKVPCILVRPETTPNDISGILASEGILTFNGGSTSHAAVVARGLQKVAVVGASKLSLIDGQWITIDGNSGTVYLGKGQIVSVANTTPEIDLDESHLPFQIRTEISKYKDLSMSNIAGKHLGMVKCELIFERQDVASEVIAALLASVDGSGSATQLSLVETATTAFFAELFETHAGKTVTIRLMDLTPLDLITGVLVDSKKKLPPRAISDVVTQLRKTVAHSHDLGQRGIRLGFGASSIYAAQIRGIAAAQKMHSMDIRVLIPFVTDPAEMKAAVNQFSKILHVPYGALLHTPKAVLSAKEIAQESAFIVFGTNQLTQLMFGMEPGYYLHYRKTLKQFESSASDPFVVLDSQVEELLKIGIQKVRDFDPDMEIGLTGNHVNDSYSLKKIAALGLDFITVTPDNHFTVMLCLAYGK